MYVPNQLDLEISTNIPLLFFIHSVTCSLLFQSNLEESHPTSSSSSQLLNWVLSPSCSLSVSPYVKQLICLACLVSNFMGRNLYIYLTVYVYLVLCFFYIYFFYWVCKYDLRTNLYVFSITEPSQVVLYNQCWH